jgi:uncharacterized protein involved in exopolysaccharide biosynthesis
MNTLVQLDLQSPTASAIVLRNWRLVTTLFCMGISISMSIFLLLPKKYESHMKLMVKNERQDLVVSAESNVSTFHQQDLSEEQVNSEVELLRSTDLLHQVVMRAHLVQNEPGTVQAAGEPSPLAVEQATARLQHDLSIEPVRKSNVITVSYTARAPALASNVLTQLTDTYLQAHLRVHNTPGTYSFFKSEADAYQSDLLNAEAALKDFRQQHSLLVMPQEQDVLAQRTVDAQAAFEEADTSVEQYRTRVQQAKHMLSAVEARITTQRRSVPNPILVQQLTTMLTELHNRRTEMVVKFRPDNRLVAQLDKEVIDTEAALNRSLTVTQTELTTDVNPVSQNAEKDILSDEIALAGLEARRQGVQRALVRYQRQMYDLAGATVQHDSLVRTVKENEANYLLYAKKREEARITESLDQRRIANVALAESPTMPVESSSPKMALDIPLAIFMSLFVSMGFVLGREYIKVRQRGAGGMPLLTVVTAEQ